MSRWVILNTRWGREVRDPSAAALASAVEELFVEVRQLIDESDFADRPEAWLRCGFDDGPVFGVVLNRNRSARFEQPGLPLLRLSLATQAEALAVWSLLAAGDLDALRALGWQERL